jgi:phosphate transport system protein
MPHKLFHDELDEVCAEVIRLGALATEAIQRGTEALLDADLGEVEQMVEADQQLDDISHHIEHRTCSLLAQQQPMAGDLRVLVTILRVNHELERIGDLMVKVAKGARRLYPEPLPPRIRGLVDRMRDQAAAQVRLAVDAFVDRDLAKAAALADMDDVMDDLQKELFQAIFSDRGAADGVLQRAVQLALIGRYYERIGDHAANFADRVQFMVTGTFPHERPPEAGAGT